MTPMGWMLQAVENLRATVCAWMGHSRCATCFLGYVYCARCDAQVGDNLGGVPRRDVLFVGKSAHDDCEDCDELRAGLSWKDTLLLPKGKRP